MGSYLWSKDGEIRQYYQRDWFDYDAVKDNVTDKNELRQALEESVKSHLMSDVPYGVLLSGGLDSSVISAITKKFAARRVEDQERSEAWWPQLHSFAVGLEGSPDLKAAQEVATTSAPYTTKFTLRSRKGWMRSATLSITSKRMT